MATLAENIQKLIGVKERLNQLSKETDSTIFDKEDLFTLNDCISLLEQSRNDKHHLERYLFNNYDIFKYNSDNHTREDENWGVFEVPLNITQIHSNALMGAYITELHLNNVVKLDSDKNEGENPSIYHRVYNRIMNESGVEVSDSTYNGWSSQVTLWLSAFGGSDVETVDAPHLKEIGYGSFAECRNLKEFDAPYLEVIGEGAFRNCTSLESFTLSDHLKSLHPHAFFNCSNLKSIFYLGTEYTDKDSLIAVLQGYNVKVDGFGGTWGDGGTDIDHQFDNTLLTATPITRNYLQFYANEGPVDITVDTSFVTELEYSFGYNEFWNRYSGKIHLNQGDKVYIRAKGVKTSYSSPIFSTSNRVECHGNVMSLLNNDFEGLTTISKSFQFSNLFKRTDITTAPELPATTLASYCYQYMFYGCTSLTTAPELPATTLASNCYERMFFDCTSLTTAPELPATTLVNNCYDNMFRGCTSLNYVKAMFTTSPSSTYTADWLYKVSPTGTFVKNSAATWELTGWGGIPSGWTVELADA